jgi:geranylgeranyl reductase family protein
METCDVLIVGGGPAGSTCAGKLRRAGLDVIVMDRERFPRDKPCAGWITPRVLEALDIDSEEYRSGRTLQDIRGFHIGVVHGDEVEVPYGKTVSYGVIRREFDHFLLERSGARLILGEAATTLERYNKGWLVNGRIKAGLLVGAGGHFCPVARVLGAKIGQEEVIVAQAAEFAMERGQERSCPIPADTPALFFCRDLKGYGWLFRKGAFLNVGLGRQDPRRLALHRREFCSFLRERGYLPKASSGPFRGHAYLAYARRGGRACTADGALLVGDAAGLSYPMSGEGILPAVESALLAADVILAAAGDYRRDNLDHYRTALSERLGGCRELPSSPLVSALIRPIGRRLISTGIFARHLVLDRWFLHNIGSIDWK